MNWTEEKLKDCCSEAKKAFILLDKLNFNNVSVMCKTCERILISK